MRLRSPIGCGLVLVLVGSACGDSAAPVDDGSTGTGSGSDSGSGSGSGVTSAEASGGPTSTTLDDDSTSSSSSSDGSDSSSSSTGEPVEPESLAMLVLGLDAAELRTYFRYRVEDEVADGPTQTHPPTGLSWEVALPFPERRVVYWERGYQVGEGDNMWLGTLDDPLPADLVQLDLRPIGIDAELSAPVALPEADAIVFVDNEAAIAYRVDFPDGVASPPVAVATGVDDYPPPTVDASGTTLLFPTNVNGGSDVGRASLLAPDPDAIDILADVAPGENASLVGLTPGGDGAFLWNGTASPELSFVALTTTPAPAAIPVVPPLAPDETGSWYHVAVDPVRPAVVYATSYSTNGGSIRWIPIEDGVPQTAITLVDSGPAGGGLGWTRDGQWLVYLTSDGVSLEMHLVHFGDDGPGEPIVFGPFDEASETYSVFDIDPAYVYVEHVARGTGELSRYPVEDGELGDPEVVLSTDADPSYGRVYAVREGTLLLSMQSGGEGALYTVDVSGPIVGEPQRVTPPFAEDDSLDGAGFSPGGQFVGYATRDDIFGYARLFLAQRALPDATVEVQTNVISWRFAPDW